MKNQMNRIKIAFITLLIVSVGTFGASTYVSAAGTFTQGSTIELSCDGPIRPPFIAYMQGGLTYEYGKLGILKAIEEMNK